MLGLSKPLRAAFSTCMGKKAVLLVRCGSHVKVALETHQREMSFILPAGLDGVRTVVQTPVKQQQFSLGGAP